MARTKKSEKKEYDWSPYQKAIFDHIEHGQGHLVVEAVAGSGKSTTLIKCIDLIPKSNKILLTAFNNDIVNELKKKTSDMDNVEVCTLHGLGFKFLKKNFVGVEITPEQFKYEAHIKSNIRDYTTNDVLRMLRGKEYFKYLENIKKYVDFGRYYMCSSEKELDFIEERYGIETMADEKEVALDVMEWGKNNITTIDYTDMIWLPNVLYLKPFGLLYDFIMVDECQDMNKAERELVFKCFKMNTRLMAVGDRMQALYSFAGSDPDSFNTLVSTPNTICLPLSISYRCGKRIVDHAKQFVKSIEASPNADEGEILRNVPLSDIKDGDMIVCRNNAPLVKIYGEFLKLGKKCYIRGKEIGSNLKTLVKGTKQELLSVECNKDGVFPRLYNDLFKTRNKMMVKYGIDSETATKSPQIQTKLDMINALEILSEGLNTADELIAKIEEIFPRKDKNDGISLSTIHKAKGLEADNVYVACDYLSPSKSAKKDWEIQQEYNLMYVAYTRAKKKLGFIDNKGFEKFDSSNTNTISTIARIEQKVSSLYGVEKVEINKYTARDIIKNATPINKSGLTKSITLNLDKDRKPRKINSFSALLKRKISK